MIPGGSPDPHSLSDHALGARIGALIAAQGGADFAAAPILSQVQDLLGADTSLLGPLRDLLVRPSFRQLVGGSQGSVRLGSRDALLQDLNATYNPAVVARLTAVIDGCLGLPASAAPAYGTSAYGAPAYAPPPQATPAYAPSAFSQPGPPSAPWSQGYGQPGPMPSAQPPLYAPQTVPARSSGNQPLMVLLILVVSLLAGGLVIAVGWLMLFNRQAVPTQAQKPASTPPAASGASGTTASQKALQPAASTPTPEPSAGAAWGSASEYKFGRLPGGDYPNSCAFSQTDGEGKIATDKTSVEYWACRDLGGDPERGYSVVWADGKQTTYTFAQGGSGTVVGTNGNSYPMRWQNDSHMGSDIIVINHQDGAQSWIPGHIRDPQD